MTALIILAMVFVFVALRLWSVLGRRTGHEQPMPKADAILVPRPAQASVPQTDASPAAGAEPAPSAEVSSGLRAIAAADPQFDTARFIDGARAAYGMILEAYWRGDADRLDRLVDAEVAEAFHHAIHDREEAGETLDNRLVSIESAQIEDVRVEEGVAYIRVHFEADVAAVTRDRDGEVVAGSLTDAIPTHDVWTFRRELRSSDPNWILAETDEAA